MLSARGELARSEEESCPAMPTEESAWVVRAKAGDGAAFAALYDRYERRIHGFAYRMVGNAADAADLTQDTFLRAYCALEKTGNALNVSAWLYRIAANACLDTLRRRRRACWLPWPVARHDTPSRDRADDPENHLIANETQRAVRRSLDAMTPRARQALILREYEGLSYAEIGAVLGVSPQAVKSILFRGREEFRRHHEALEAPRGPTGPRK